jgi:hypothetical protein
MVDLILKDIQDPYVRENFFRLRKFLDQQIFFDGDFKLYDINVEKKETEFKIAHGLTFIPADIILLSVSGDYNFYFNYQDFDKDNMYVTTDGPVRIRFLAGKLSDQIKNQPNKNPFPFVPPNDFVLPGSPGFVYGAVASKTTGFWLTSENIPSNVVGVPVVFGNARIVQAAVGTEVESNYTIGIYEHEGAGINLTQVGTFSITNGGPKRVALDLALTSTSPNLQLATRLETGNTLNLKVSLILKGTGI